MKQFTSSGSVRFPCLSDRDRALSGICLYTGCHITEACSMLTTDGYDAAGVRTNISILIDWFNPV
ncbi:hypothetical protein [Trichocoleus sp. FACHB-262]|uniref:hypothetical protein n=1 Tax=Trichocoleus sp. FACHB-262 TaxID=2692869 RepID=UPI00168846D6|nr:hypothetical protein [Trichocoleus sp. FACHB-262]MBD2120975.1 hypothetical protein [Trichocoleus sp. FACHB-262]